MVATPEVDRDVLIGQYQSRQAENDDWIRVQVLQYGRRDILAREVLGYQVEPFHLSLQLHMARHPHSLQLAFRGCGKSTVLTICGAIFDMLCDPDVRICIASKTGGHATDILTEIKGHLENNEKFRRIFGDLVGPKWNEDEIVTSTRTRPRKEPTIFAVGIGGQVVGKHFDSVYCDDLVDEPNSRTKLLRERTKTWYYIQLTPTFEPHCTVHIIGTRYHYDDLYGHLILTDMKGEKTQIIRALDRHGRSPWPAKFSAKFFRGLREKMGLILFNSQFLCDTEAMKGGIFRHEWLDFVDAEDVPETLGFGGVDLAIKEKEDNDKFAKVGIGITKDGHIYVHASYARRLGFKAQTSSILDSWRDGFGVYGDGNDGESRLVEIGVEDNAYQDAQLQVLQDEEPGIRLVPIRTIKDKHTRAIKLAARAEAGKIHIVGTQHELVESLVLFPNGEDDLFDALDHAVTTAFRPKRRRKGRSRKVGVIGGPTTPALRRRSRVR